MFGRALAEVAIMGKRGLFGGGVESLWMLAKQECALT